jgi:capsular polysaccharide biosynthesis protein
MINQIHNENNNSLEIDFLELFKVVYSQKKLVISVAIISALLSVIYAMTLPNIYKSEVLLAPNASSSSNLSQMTSSLGGLAGLTGLNLGGMSGENRKNLIAIETLKSRKFFSDYLYDQMLVELFAIKKWDAGTKENQIDPDIYNTKTNTWNSESGYSLNGKPSVQEAHSEFMGILNVIQDIEKAGLTTIIIEHKSPYVAKRWIDLIVGSLNEAIRKTDISIAQDAIDFLVLQLSNTKQLALNDAFSSLIEEQTKTMMLANISNEYVFKTIDPAVVSEKKSSPRRSIIVILGTILGGLSSIIFILLRYFYKID